MRIFLGIFFLSVITHINCIHGYLKFLVGELIEDGSFGVKVRDHLHLPRYDKFCCPDDLLRVFFSFVRLRS